MDFSTFLTILAYYLPPMDQSLKPKDSFECEECRNTKFDFIIVGGGSAGCVLANRLSTTNSKWKVLLIEAGGDEDYVTDIPALAGIPYAFSNTKYVWNFTTVQQNYACRDKQPQGICPVNQGHALGGSSVIGDLLYMRGNKADYDQWEKSGNPGWSYENVLQYFLKSENITIPKLISSPYHATGGLLPVAYTPYKSGLIKNFVESAINFGIPQRDYNGENQNAIDYSQLNLIGGRRCSSAKAYLDPIKGAKNLCIFKNTLATRIIYDENNGVAVGVSCVTNGKEYEAYASKEIVISAGAINTAKLLMLSGIGPKEHLKELGIPVYADLPVGQQFTDYPRITFNLSTTTGELKYDNERLTEAIKEYAECGQGILTAPQKLTVASANIEDFIKNVTLTSDILPDVFFNDGYYIDFFHNSPSIIQVYGTIITNTTKGNIKLRSKNYKDNPIIDLKYFQLESERKNIMEQLQIQIQFFNSSNWNDYSPKFMAPYQCNYTGNVTQEFADCYIKYKTFVGQNPISTAKMGPSSDKTTVVDPELKVHGIGKLRVVDASIIPGPLRATPYATVVMIAEKAFDLIKKDY